MSIRRVVQRGNTYYVSIPKEIVERKHIEAVKIEEKEDELILHILH